MKSKKLHLSTLMFFQLAVAGSYAPILSIYLKEYLGFTGIQTGAILSVGAVPSILSPFISAWIVDRVITSRRFLMFSHVIGTLLIVILSFEKSFSLVFITYLIYVIFFIPTSALVTTVVFHYIEDRNNFGKIRLWGTIGWIASGWIVSLIWRIFPGRENMPIALQLSALYSVTVILLTYKLPKLELDRDKKISLIPHETVTVLKKPEIIILLLIILVSASGYRFLTFGMPIFLQQSGVPQNNILIILSLGQISEVFVLMALSRVIRKIGFKNSFIIGLSFELLRYTLFRLTGPLVLTIIGISLHGFVYALFFAAGSIYLDHFSDEKSRGGLHLIYNMMFIGAPNLIGNLLAGYSADHFSRDGLIEFHTYWMIPLLISIFTLLTLIFKVKRITQK